MFTEIIQLNEQRKVSLTAYIQDAGGEFDYVEKRPAILVIPGGGYQFCSAREADPVALAYMKAGYQAFVLRYSVAENGTWPNPLEDYEQAMDMIRSNAEKWMLYEDKVAVIGFSAGGHLAAAAATMSKNRPNAAILGYAVAGADVKSCNPTAPDTVAAVDKNTCPCFLFSTRTDNLVPVENTLDFMSALAKHGIAFESHIYAFGPHGFSTCDSSIQYRETKMCNRVANWVEDSIGWLKDIFGDFGREGMTEPACDGHANGNHLSYLSVDCTLGKLMEVPEAAEVVKGFLEAAKEKANAVEFADVYNSQFQKLILRGILGFASTPKEVVDALDAQLRMIKNKD